MQPGQRARPGPVSAPGPVTDPIDDAGKDADQPRPRRAVADTRANLVQPVSTGLDLFSKAEGGHNFATIVFYETGYNLFTMRQAARRAWRIGQPKDCRVYYLYYRETMQHRAMQLMSRKMAAAQVLEGEFSEDGLAAMAGEDNLQMALAKSIARTIDDAEARVRRANSAPCWSRRRFASRFFLRSRRDSC